MTWRAISAGPCYPTHLHSCFLSLMASYDAASNVWQGLWSRVAGAGGWRPSATRTAPGPGRRRRCSASRASRQVAYVENKPNEENGTRTMIDVRVPLRGQVPSLGNTQLICASRATPPKCDVSYQLHLTSVECLFSMTLLPGGVRRTVLPRRGARGRHPVGAADPRVPPRHAAHRPHPHRRQHRYGCAGTCPKPPFNKPPVHPLNTPCLARNTPLTPPEHPLPGPIYLLNTSQTPPKHRQNTP